MCYGFLWRFLINFWDLSKFEIVDLNGNKVYISQVLDGNGVNITKHFVYYMYFVTQDTKELAMYLCDFELKDIMIMYGTNKKRHIIRIDLTNNTYSSGESIDFNRIDFS